MVPGQKCRLAMRFEDAVSAVIDALKSEGFGVLADIDVRETLRQKLGIEWRRYRILGACNPPLAHRALGVDLDAGLMMPCNVILYETDDGQVVVNAIDPMETIATQHDGLRPIAAEVRSKLARVLDRLPA